MMTEEEATAAADALVRRLGPGWTPVVAASRHKADGTDRTTFHYHATAGYLTMFEHVLPGGHATYVAFMGAPGQTAPYASAGHENRTPEKALSACFERAERDVAHRTRVLAEATASLSRLEHLARSSGGEAL